MIYDTTRTSNQGAEITAAANGPATSLADLIVLGDTDRFVCELLESSLRSPRRPV